MQPSIRFVETADGVSIAYVSHGAGPPLVYVRGWTSHLELSWAGTAFRTYFEALAAHLTVTRFDARGNGLSGRRPADLSLDGLVADLEAVIDTIGVERISLLGTFYGGPIAATYAARHPERVERLVLADTYARGADFGRKARDHVLALVANMHSQPWAAAGLSYLTSPDLEGSHRQRIEAARQSVDAKVANTLYQLGFSLDVGAELRSVQAPTLVLHRRDGSASPFLLGQKVAALVPSARLVALDGSAANLWEQQPQQSLAAIGKFLELPEPVGLARAGPTIRPLTVLFTDLVGSTAFTARLGDELAQVMVRVHDTLVDRALAHHGGTRHKHTGDGVMASFPSATPALAASTALLRSIDEHNAARPEDAITIRIGINAGEPLAEDGDLFGTVVQLAARVCDAAEPGQVLMTNVVRETAAGKGQRFEDCGLHAMRGLEEPVHLWALRRDQPSKD